MEKEEPRMSSIHKVSGGTKEEKQEVLEEMESNFQKEFFYKNAEKEKTGEEKKIINSVISKINIFLAKYGARPLDLKDTNVHIFDETLFDDEAREYMMRKYGSNTRGYYRHNHQNVVIFGHTIISRLDLATVLSHELIHFLAYNSLVIDNNIIRPHRYGLAVQPPRHEPSNTGMMYLNEINEAVTEELNVRFYSEIVKDPLFKEEYSYVDRYRKYREMEGANEAVAFSKTKEYPDGGFEWKVLTHSYVQLRKKFNLLLDRIYTSRKNEFSSREDVFDIFARAAMTGDVKRLASLMDTTFGEGSFKSLSKSLDKFPIK